MKRFKAARRRQLSVREIRAILHHRWRLCPDTYSKPYLRRLAGDINLALKLADVGHSEAVRFMSELTALVA